MRKDSGMRNSEGYFDPTAGIAERNVMKEQRGALPMTFNPDINRGDVFYVDRVQSYGHEQRAGRPAIVVSNDVNNSHSSVVEIVYLTTQPKTDMPTHVLVRATGIPSTALCEQVQTVDASRLGSFCGHCSATEMQAIDTALLVSLGLDMGGVSRDEPTPPEPVQEAVEEQSDGGDIYQELVVARAQLELMRTLYDSLLLRTAGKSA